MSRRSRRVASVLAAAAVATALVVLPAGSASAASGGACQLTGVADLSPGLSTTSQAFNYSFGGALTGCQSNIAGAPTSGTASAGKALPETVTCTETATGATSPCTVQYRQPVPSGSGSCGSSTTAGKALVQWADGTTTVVDYTTTGALAAVRLSGQVVPSLTLDLIASSVPAGFTAPATFVIPTTRFNPGESAGAALKFSPKSGQDCATVPVTTADINGVVAVGTVP
jgi:hypothetical protein